MTRITIALTALALVTAACAPFSEKDKENLKKACAGAPATLHQRPAELKSFPDAQGIFYVAVQKKGPATVATGFVNKTIGPAHRSYSQALKNAAGYSVTKEEQDVADAEVNFAGHGTSGQVKMVQECKSRTNVTITIRPS
ncbi:MAG TPA: hypothetical protein VI408_09865 [Gaiellaceae bacterium]